MVVTIEKMDNFGRGIAYLENKICFVENALPGEIVDITIKKENKKYCEALVEKYLKVSPLRIEDECFYQKQCGGCCLGHLTFEEENKWKEEKVKSLFRKYASVFEDKIEPIVYHERYEYRNKIVLHGKEGKLGLYQEKTNDVVPISKCLLVNEKINTIIEKLQKQKNNIEEAIIKTSNDESKVMLSLTGEVENRDELLENIDVLLINNHYYTKETKLLTQIGTKQFYEGIHSFFQVNKTLTEALYGEVIDEVKKNHYSNVLDLYCGTGTIGICISDYVDKVIGIDSNLSNIEDALKNKELNKTVNIEFICDKVENQISSFKNIDLIIVDPPRAGLDFKTKEYLQEIKPQKIIYISCDPVTLTRDVSDLKKIYEVDRVKPFNMFPCTYHVECVCLLCKRN